MKPNNKNVIEEIKEDVLAIVDAIQMAEDELGYLRGQGNYGSLDQGWVEDLIKACLLNRSIDKNYTPNELVQKKCECEVKKFVEWYNNVPYGSDEYSSLIEEQDVEEYFVKTQKRKEVEE